MLGHELLTAACPPTMRDVALLGAVFGPAPQFANNCLGNLLKLGPETDAAFAET